MREVLQHESACNRRTAVKSSMRRRASTHAGLAMKSMVWHFPASGSTFSCGCYNQRNLPVACLRDCRGPINGLPSYSPPDGTDDPVSHGIDYFSHMVCRGVPGFLCGAGRVDGNNLAGQPRRFDMSELQVHVFLRCPGLRRRAAGGLPELCGQIRSSVATQSARGRSGPDRPHGLSGAAATALGSRRLSSVERTGRISWSSGLSVCPAKRSKSKTATFTPTARFSERPCGSSGRCESSCTTMITPAPRHAGGRKTPEATGAVSTDASSMRRTRATTLAGSSITTQVPASDNAQTARADHRLRLL